MNRLRSVLDALRTSGSGDRLHLWLPMAVGLLLLVGLSYAVLNLSPIVPIGLLSGIFGTLFFFIQPALSLLIMLALRIVLDLLWWVPGSIAGLNLLKLFSGAATVLGGALFALEFRRTEHHPSIGAFILFTLVLGLSAARNISVMVGLEIAVRYLSPIMMLFLVAGFLPSARDNRRFMIMMLLVSCIPLLSSLYYLASGQMNQHTLAGYNRLLGGYKSLRHHGMMMMLMAALGTFWLFQARDRRSQVLIVGFTAGSALCMYLSYIRTGVLAFAAFVAAFLYISGRRREFYLAVGLAALGTALSPEIQDRFKDLVLVFFMDSDDMFNESRKLGSGRIGLWGDSFKAYLQRPLGDILLGLGLGKHWILTQEAYNPFVTVQDGQVDTHSDYLGVLYQLGPIALGAYIYIQAQTVYYGWKLANMRSADRFSQDLGALAAALSIAVFVTNTISNGFVNRTTLGWFFWSIAGLMFAAYHRIQQEQQQALREQTIPLRPDTGA